MTFHKRLHPRPQRRLCRLNTYGKRGTCGAFAEPSDGLEPLTPLYEEGPCVNWLV